MAKKHDIGDVWFTHLGINIQVTPVWDYQTRFTRIGNPDDSPAFETMWGWVNHLREKIWFTKDVEQKFIRLALSKYGTA